VTCPVPSNILHYRGSRQTQLIVTDSEVKNNREVSTLPSDKGHNDIRDTEGTQLCPLESQDQSRGFKSTLHY